MTGKLQESGKTCQEPLTLAAGGDEARGLPGQQQLHSELEKMPLGSAANRAGKSAVRQPERGTALCTAVHAEGHAGRAPKALTS